MNKLNKPVQNAFKFQIITVIQVKCTYGIRLLCLLKDKRLVSCVFGNSIRVYDRGYQLQFNIERAHNDMINSLCALKNDELVSASDNGEIKVWRINKDDYHLIHTIKGHSRDVNKVIELKDGKFSSCSDDGTIKIWDNYKCIKTLKPHIGLVRLFKGFYKSISLIIEMNNYIVSISQDNELKIWDESTYKCIQTIKGFEYWSRDSISKLDDNTLALGHEDLIYFVNIKTYQINTFEHRSLGAITSLYGNGNGLVFIGNKKGEMLCYDSSSNQIIFKNKFHNHLISYLIGGEDNQIFSCSLDKKFPICLLETLKDKEKIKHLKKKLNILKHDFLFKNDNALREEDYKYEGDVEELEKMIYEKERNISDSLKHSEILTKGPNDKTEKENSEVKVKVEKRNLKKRIKVDAENKEKIMSGEKEIYNEINKKQKPIKKFRMKFNMILMIITM